jgi:hypothetical protein
LAAQAASGQTPAEYCRCEGIPSNGFYRWRRLLASSLAVAGKPSFVEVTVPATLLRSSGVSLVGRAGWRVELSRDFDRETLQRLLTCDLAPEACSG